MHDPASWFRKTWFTRRRVRELKNAHNSVTVQNRTHVYMNFFHHKDLGNRLLQLCPKVVKHSVCMWLVFVDSTKLADLWTAYTRACARAHTHTPIVHGGCNPCWCLRLLFVQWYDLWSSVVAVEFRCGLCGTDEK